eukprot:TRINITY_DN2_c0_g2_i1.p1 TRINITY_DN2_c0_g2~~TRINITY_DN2_c0_g2_i1.p1  ORF type:complete len:294 (+),score=32.65 TRINITY_DN2_c0_g2_i1:109-990(+)
MATVTPSSPFLLSLTPQFCTPHSKIVGLRCHNTKRSSGSRKRIEIACPAFRNDARQSENTVYQGMYGTWTVEDSDYREVLLYRGGLVTSALSFVLGASSAFLPDENPAKLFLQEHLDTFYALGVGSLGLSLILIHIYVTPLKRALQTFWTLGIIGSVVLSWNFAHPAGKGLVQYVIDNPSAVWFIGPVFASLTGLVFKEGLCYGKPEAAILTLVIPTLLLSHLAGFLDNQSKQVLLGVWMALFIIFACRKFTQPVKDDIGDKSIFIFNSLSEEEKKAFLDGNRDLVSQGFNRN